MKKLLLILLPVLLVLLSCGPTPEEEVGRHLSEMSKAYSEFASQLDNAATADQVVHAFTELSAIQEKLLIRSKVLEEKYPDLDPNSEKLKPHTEELETALKRMTKSLANTMVKYSDDPRVMKEFQNLLQNLDQSRKKE